MEEGGGLGDGADGGEAVLLAEVEKLLAGVDDALGMGGGRGGSEGKTLAHGNGRGGGRRDGGGGGRTGGETGGDELGEGGLLGSVGTAAAHVVVGSLGDELVMAFLLFGGEEVVFEVDEEDDLVIGTTFLDGTGTDGDVGLLS